MVPVPHPDAPAKRPGRQPLWASALLFAWCVAGSFPLPAQAQTCSSQGDPRSTAYQKRGQMQRCEGESPKPIAASGLWLDNFSIGSPKSRTSGDNGKEIVLRIPRTGPSDPVPEVTVETSRGNYKMKPLEWRKAGGSWQEFVWGVGVLNQLGIRPEQLRATALIRGGGAAERQLPVWFGDADRYTVIVGSNAPVRLRVFRVKGPDGRVVVDFLSTGSDSLRASWDARRMPRGQYTVEARAEDPASGPLIMQVEHDPRWLQP